MTVDSLAAWLRCPQCAKPLAPVERLAVGCASGHRFDVNKRGYVNLLGETKLIGDNAEMLDARETVLEGGFYEPIANALTSAASGRAILDAGAGTGYYLRAVLAADPSARGLAMDLSPTAVARSVRSSARIDGLVADTWRPLPVRDAVCDVILDVFAPRNLPEFHRVLKPGGSLLVVIPLPEHLAELRAAGRMLDVPSHKAATILDSTAPLFELYGRHTVRATIPLSVEVADALVGMGPSAHHTHIRPSGAVDLPTATLAVELLHLIRT